MSVTPGTHLGPYEILSALGAGGMGEVYKARDTRLDRIVAIKILPEALASDPQFRERFDREARAISQLTHPHICTLYDVGEQEGTAFLVMEHLEGETLADRLKKGALPLDQALTTAIQIASALDKAHRAGITHRDLKPGNIMLTKAGAKLLDFGLAKTTAPVVAGAGLSMLPTTPPNLTAQGTILGTFQYMAPEQLEGQDADARTDIFAFGALVYEMLTGKKAFEGKSQASLIAAILEREPPAITSLQPLAPPAIDRIVKKCLAKEPDERWQSAKDLHDELKWIAERSSQVGAPAPAAPPARTSRMRERIAWSAAVVVLAAAATAVSVRHLREPAAAPAPEMRVDIVTPPTSDPLSFALSPDGRRLVFVASEGGNPQLWLRPLDSATAQPLAGTEGARFPFWSPDSRSIAFFGDGKLKRIDVGGGSPQVLANSLGLFGGAWSPDGVILFGSNTNGPLLRVSASGGEALPATRLSPPHQYRHSFPQFLPGGRQFLFYASGTEEGQGIYLGSLDTSDTQRLTAADAAGAYVTPGWLLFLRQDTLVARRFDPARRVLTGDLVTVAESSIFIDRYVAALSTSGSGTVAYRAGGNSQQLRWFDRSGQMLGSVGAPGHGLADPALSPDGRRVAVRRSVQGNSDIWVVDAARTVRFTFESSPEQYPEWSPDGNWIAFGSAPKGRYDLYRKRSSGAGAAELLLESSQGKNLDDWSPDGRFLLFDSEDPKTGRDLWVLPLDGDRKPFEFLKTPFEEHRGQFSPDGRWIAYVSNESGRPEIYVRPFQPGTRSQASGQSQISTAGGIQPRWGPQGHEVYYIAPDGKLMAARIAVKTTAIEPGVPTPLFTTRIVGGGTNTYAKPQYDVAPDGRFLINVTTDEGTMSPITLLLNWKPR